MGLNIKLSKKLVINLDKLRSNITIPECSYPFNANNNGFVNLLDIASYLLICRHCEKGACVKSCPTEALTRNEEGILKRYNLRCISCKSCSVACPFGTIIPEMLPYQVAMCDYCIDRINGKPSCVKDLNNKEILDFKNIDDIPEDYISVGEHLAVYSTKWQGGKEVKL